MVFSSVFRKHLPIGLSVLLCLSLSAGGVSTESTPASGRGVKLLSSGDQGVRFNVLAGNYRLSNSKFLRDTETLSIPGYATLSRPGEPWIPSKKYLIAIPADCEYSLHARIIGMKRLGKHRLQPVPMPVLINQGEAQPLLSESYELKKDIYFAYKARAVASADSAAYIRHQRVLPIWINPVIYDPASGDLTVVTELQVEVVFSSRRSKEESIPGGFVPVREAPGWERILSRVLLNPGEAPKWRVKKVEDGKSSNGLMRSSTQPPAGPMVKVCVHTTGMHKVKASNLFLNGFPQGEDIANVVLFKRYYDVQTMQEGYVDVPFIVREDPSGTPGVFDDGDYMIFYGQRLRDDTLQDDPTEKFAAYNAYWVGTGGGEQMPQAQLRRGFVTGDTSSAAFTLLDRYEQDNIFQEETPEAKFGEPPLEQDPYFYNYYNVPSLSIPFTIHAIKPGTTMHLQAEFIGGVLSITTIRQLYLSIENTNGTFDINDVFVSGNNRITYNSQAVPASELVEGSNTFEIDPEPGKSSIGGVLNWFTVEYSSLYRAKSNALTFDTASLTGDTTISITALSRTDLLLFDVTDAFNVKQCVVTDSLFTDTGNGLVFSFRDQIATKKKYILTPLEAIDEIGAGDLKSESTGGIIGNAMESGVDVLVICYKDFLGEMQRWVDYRRAQGYKVFMVDVESVFDEFNGGVPNARALKDLIRHYYLKAGASVVLLVGDASEDNKRVHSDSGINFVPTQSYPERIDAAPFNQDEMVTSDKWYVLMGNDYKLGQGDYYPDLVLGRLPAGSVRELQIMLDKIFAFERPSASDFWRRRMIQIAYDAWSTKGFTDSTCYRPSELGFETGEEEAATIVDTSLAGGFDVVREYLSRYTSVVHPVNSGCVDNEEVKAYTRTHALPDLLNAIAQGATLISIQAHMNRYLITHETLFSSSDVVGRDHQKLENFGRPFIVFGMGCHLSDYAINRELAWLVNNDINGDCIDELLLLLNNRGAVSTYGSSGFEYLGENVSFTDNIYDIFFNNPPTDTMIASNRAQARWIFGELMAVSEMLGANSGQIKRYHLLGDPLLRIDAGPPRFQVTVNGQPVNSGDVVQVASTNDTIFVEALVSDENAIEKFELIIDGTDESSSLTRQALVDENLSAARKYRVSFSHKLMPKSYEIVLRALQSPDTVSGQYHIAAEFVLDVPLDIELQVNGRSVVDGDMVPSEGNYVITLKLPSFTPAEEIQVLADGEPVAPLNLSHPSPQDTTSWIITFTKSLEEGEHIIAVEISGTEIRRYRLLVSSRPGITQLIPYPNPFAKDTYFVFHNDAPIEDGHIDIYTTSGRKIMSLPIPLRARMPGQNAVYWDGNDYAGDSVANGVYLYIVSIVQQGERRTFKGKVARIR